MSVSTEVSAPASIAERLARLRRRIADACERSGREPDAVTLIGASKRQPLERLREAAAAGLEVFGENQVQEAETKIPELPVGLDWHFIGTLQSNKAKAAVRLFDTVHSIDRVKIAQKLDHEAVLQGRRLRGLVQVNLGSETSKHGFPDDPEDLVRAVCPLAELERLEIVGLMAIPPRAEDVEQTRLWLRRLRELRDRLAREPDWRDFPGWLSMGMSHDFELAVEEGATHVRLGTCLFGARPW